MITNTESAYVICKYICSTQAKWEVSQNTRNYAAEGSTAVGHAGTTFWHNQPLFQFVGIKEMSLLGNCFSLRIAPPKSLICSDGKLQRGAVP